MAKKSKRRGFEYRESDRAAAKEIASGSSKYDPMFTLPEIEFYEWKTGLNKFRIMPWTWPDTEGPRHWGYEAHIHYEVGPDKGAYLCPARMRRGSYCPVCEERKKLDAENDEDGARALLPSRTVLCWVIDRDNEDKGPVLMKMPAKKVAQEIIDRADDPDTGELLAVDHPDEGYDIRLKRTGKGKTGTEYSGVTVASKATPLCDDEDEQDDWLEFITENNIPSILKIYDGEYIAKIFNGQSPAPQVEEEDEDDEEPIRTRRSRRSKKEEEDEEEEDEEPRARRSKRRAEPEEDDEEEDEDEPPRRRSKSKSRRAESEEDGEEDDEEEEQPRARRSKSKRRPDPEPEEDEEEEDEEEEEEDDEPPRRRSKKAKSRRISDEELDEPDDEPVRTSRKKSATKRRRRTL